ncbi:MAG: M23 family metallopeptidase, partial [Actinomycetota bacterium]|nr:M23 family metallopeptidase [Actinomycetota bacterium]
TGGRTAADVVVDPAAEIRSPVTGRVLRAGTYVLYCDYSDDYAVIEPDGRPGWEVKLLHIDGVLVGPGERVRAGETVLARRPTQLPFESQVDEVTVPPAWPHVHIEVVDPSIPDRPSGGRC